jgi:hypothetical protein
MFLENIMVAHIGNCNSYDNSTHHHILIFHHNLNVGHFWPIFKSFATT